MIKVFTKKIILILLLGLLSSQLAHAEIKNYQYDGKLPFVQMMLNMMVAMGILDRVPANGIYSPYGMSNNRYARLWGNRNGFNGGGFNRSWPDRWSHSQNDVDWGQPRWGVLPEDSYSLRGWVNEPWEMSVWNNTKQKKQEIAGRKNDNTPVNKQAVSEQAVNNQALSKQNTALKQKACVTDFCGLQAPSLNGLWISREGEMLGVKNNSFLWSDGQSRHLTGNIKRNNNYLVASADGYQQLMYFKYKLDGNYLLTMQPDGRTREFRRVSNGQSGSSGYAPRYNNLMQGDGRDHY